MRVYARQPRLSDEAAFTKKARASIDMHRPWVFPTTTAAGYKAYLEQLESARYAGFLICRRTDAEILGVVNVSEIVYGVVRGGFVGYWAFAGHEGKGYLTEGLALVFDEVFSKMGLHRLEVNIQPPNTRSKALVQRLGLRKEGYSPKYLRIGGEWKDHERWAILAEEWLARGGSLSIAQGAPNG